MIYSEFFQTATQYKPFPFQERFRNEDGPRVILRAPTGTGKTQTVLVAWLDELRNLTYAPPRRLIWCLPSRSLTGQVADVAKECIARLVEAKLIPSVRVCRLLGGSEDNSLTLAPDEPTFIAGTQDLLLSRALNRGYARRPLRWPIDFALLNNDCWWVFDEVQLLGDGLATSTQLAAFREQFGVFGSARTCWISATFDPVWLNTVDYTSLAPNTTVIEPGGQDLADAVIHRRIHAEKRILQAPPACRLPEGVAELTAAEHRPGTLTLVIANTVRRAVEIRAALEKKTKAELRLLHSRFRAADRRAHLDAVVRGSLPEAGRIVVATQVIEAGMDLDATLMITDIAPYANMVQRFGRANRMGDQTGCRIYWVDRPLQAKRKTWADVAELKSRDAEEVCWPYDPEEVARAAKLLAGMESASPADLGGISAMGSAPWRHVLRRSDVLDLFDTSADLGGHDVDISRFVRSDPERDIYVFWRGWKDKDQAPDHKNDLDEGELCPAPIGDLDLAPRIAWTWDTVRRCWTRPEKVFPGMTLMLHTSEGKYTSEYGWSPESKASVVPMDSGEEDRDEGDKRSLGCRQLLTDHTDQVCEEMARFIGALKDIGLEPFRAALECAARNHDWGKAHRIMQETLHGMDVYPDEILAKQRRGQGNGKHSRPGFRHELASALAMIAAGEEDLAAYVAAAHHGQVRVSIRSMRGEQDGEKVRIRGIEEGEMIPRCSLGGGVERMVATMRLEPALLGANSSGSPSWTDRVLRLRDAHGPFRLAYLEMLLRIADETASKRAETEAAACSFS